MLQQIVKKSINIHSVMYVKWVIKKWVMNLEVVLKDFLESVQYNLIERKSKLPYLKVVNWEFVLSKTSEKCN